ncbi:MAG: 1-hydroxy-2-methyl-2-butenyl 4-diphosphate reductase [Acidimicrobiales bacterium]
MGPRRSQAFLGKMCSAVPDLVAHPIPAVAVMGFCGALQPGISAGDLVVATEVRGPDGTSTPVAGAVVAEVAAVLRKAGNVVHLGPVSSVDHLVRGAERAKLGLGGALAVDMESAWLVQGLSGSPVEFGPPAGSGAPVAVVRAVVDTPAAGLASLATIPAGIRARRSLGLAARSLSAARSRISIATPVPFKEVK